MKTIVLCGFILGLCCSVLAVERVWTGGGSDSNWSTADNWGGTAPVAGDSLVFAGTTGLVNTNDFPSGTSFAGIKFNSGAGSFVLNGNKIILAGELISEDDSYQTLNLPVDLISDTTVISNNVSDSRIVLNGHIGGNGGIFKDGDAYLEITASNSYDGATLIQRGRVIAKDSFAFGSTNGITTVHRVESGNGSLEIDGDGMNIYESFEFRNVDTTGYSFINRQGSNTLHAAYTVQGGRHFFDSGTTCVFKKGISPIGDPMTILCGSGTIIFDDKVNLGSDGRFYADQWTRIYLNVSSNIWGLTTFGRGHLIMNAVNALPENTSFKLALGYGPYGTLDLSWLTWT
ncbi:MAG: hypothetical protein R6V06_00755 [Kiritimatiellia bacterium]